MWTAVTVCIQCKSMLVVITCILHMWFDMDFWCFAGICFHSFRMHFLFIVISLSIQDTKSLKENPGHFVINWPSSHAVFFWNCGFFKPTKEYSEVILFLVWTLQVCLSRRQCHRCHRTLNTFDDMTNYLLVDVGLIWFLILILILGEKTSSIEYDSRLQSITAGQS
jgi:hypothetical protein